MFYWDIDYNDTTLQQSLTWQSYMCDHAKDPDTDLLDGWVPRGMMASPLPVLDRHPAEVIFE